jgi:O-antigen/teichoic acid export membrane protein
LIKYNLLFSTPDNLSGFFNQIKLVLVDNLLVLYIFTTMATLHDPLFKNSYYLMGNTILSAGSGLFFWTFAPRFNSPKELGLGSAMLAAMGLLCMLSLLGFDIGLIRYLPGEEDKGGMINSCFVMAGLAAALLSVVFLCGLHIWSPALLVLRERTGWVLD